MHRFVLTAALAASATGLLFSHSASASAPAAVQDAPRPADALTCDPAVVKPESYRLSVEAQALNLTQPRYRWWDRYDIGKGTKDVDSLNDAAIVIGERARQLDERNLLAHAQLARHYVIGATDAKKAHDEWRRTLDAGGVIAWAAMLPEVDRSSYFVLAFDRAGIRIFRFGQLAGALRTRYGVPDFPGPDREEFWRALGGCLTDTIPADATIPWSAVQEIGADSFSLGFKLDRPVAVTSDRRKRREDDWLVVSLFGAQPDFDPRTFGYGRMARYHPVAMGPAAFQERVRGTLIEIFDPQSRIRLPKQRRLGW